jgi:hypothetical protein
MNEREAKEQLELMLDKLTAGSILHLLSEVFREAAEQTNDARSHQQFKQVEEALYVVGLGVDAACPR